MKLNKARVLVIGGSSGIGFAVAKLASDEGAKVTLASSNPGKLNAAAARLDSADTVQLDVTNEDQLERYFESSGKFDHVVFTAGDWGGVRDRITELNREAAEKVFEIRFWGALNVVKYGLKALSEEGSFTFTGGMTAHTPQPGTVVATSLTGSLEFMTRALAVELAPVRVNLVCPGPTLTEAWDAFPPALHKQAEKHIQTHLLKKIASPAEVAVAYLYLLTGTYTTGQVLYVEGGSMLGH